MDDLQRLAARITARWERLTRSQRIVVIALCAAGAVGMFTLRHRLDATDWQPIATGREFSAKEISAIQTAWRRQGLTGSRRDGGMLNVPKVELAKYQSALPQTVTTNADSASEWDKQLSGVNAFTSSEQLEQRKDNALRNELRRVLRAIPSIADADVIWARGKSRSAFSGRGKVTATVNITPKYGHDLTPELGQSLRSAVASMIADLNPADIVVLDQSTGLALPDESNSAWTARLQQRQLERSAKQLEQQLLTALAHVGDVKVQVVRSRSRETSESDDNWRVSVSVPETHAAQSAITELRREVTSLLPTEFSKSDIRITTHVSELVNSVNQTPSFTAWPHMICAGFAAFCLFFGFKKNSGEPVGNVNRTSDQQSGDQQSGDQQTVDQQSVREPMPSGLLNPSHTELDKLQATSAQALAGALRHERPQTIAVLATRLPSRLVSDTLARLPAETQLEIIRRLKSLGDVPEELVTEIAKTVCRRLGMNSTSEPLNRIAAVHAGISLPERVAA